MSTAVVSSAYTLPPRTVGSQAIFGTYPRTPDISFFLFILVNATVFLRPAEIVPELRGLPIYETLIFSCLFFSLPEVLDELQPRSLYHNPISVCVLGVWMACPISHFLHGAAGDSSESLFLFFRTALYYLLFVTCVDTPDRFKAFLLNTTVCSALMVTLCVIDYYEYVDFTFVTHVTDRDGEDEIGETELVLRMRGTGIFEDPNDISVLIVTSIVLCFYFSERPNSQYIASFLDATHGNVDDWPAVHTIARRAAFLGSRRNDLYRTPFRPWLGHRDGDRCTDRISVGRGTTG